MPHRMVNGAGFTANRTILPSQRPTSRFRVSNVYQNERRITQFSFRQQLALSTGRRVRCAASKRGGVDSIDGAVLERPKNSVSESAEVGTSSSCEGLSGNEGLVRGILKNFEGFGGWLPKGAALGLGGAVFGQGVSLDEPASLAEAIGILALIVAVHECGHFLAARLQNIHVSKFAIGFGPPLIQYQGPEVEYSVRAFPLGGFVGFPDDDPDNPYPEDDPDLLRNRSIPQRALVISAGVLANLIFAYTILFAQVMTVGVANEQFRPGVVLPNVISDSVAEKAGLRTGDLILSIEGVQMGTDKSPVPAVVEAINGHPNQPLYLTVSREGKSFPVTVIPAPGPDGKGRVGLQLAANRSYTHTVAQGIFDGIVLASSEFGKITSDMISGLSSILFNFSQTAQQVSGPVAIVAVGADIARLDSTQLFTFAAVINVNLAVVNVLPLPALDGGYLALLALEAIRGGKKLPEQIEQGVMASGLLLLMALGSFLVVRDTVNLGILP